MTAEALFATIDGRLALSGGVCNFGGSRTTAIVDMKAGMQPA